MTTFRVKEVATNVGGPETAIVNRSTVIFSSVGNWPTEQARSSTLDHHQTAHSFQARPERHNSVGGFILLSFTAALCAASERSEFFEQFKIKSTCNSHQTEQLDRQARHGEQ
jgi:hypothetical protein